MLAVHGVDNRLARIHAHGGFHGNRIRRVDLQGQRRHALDFAHERHERRRLVDFGQAGVHVKRVGARFRLGNGFAQHIVEIALAKRGLELLLARRVDALANGGNVATSQKRGMARRRNAARRSHVALDGRAARHERRLFRDIVGVRAAAAAHDRHAFVDHRRHGFDVFIGGHREHGFAIDNARQAGIGLHHDGNRGRFEHFAHHRAQVVGAKRAIHAQNVNAKRRKHNGRDLGARAQERAAIFAEGHRGENGQIGVFFRSENGGLHLKKVGHGFNDEQIGPSRIGRTHLFGEQLIRFIEGHRAERFEQRARRANIGCHVFRARRLAARNGRREHIGHAGGVAKLAAIRAEGVGAHNLASRLHILGMDTRDFLGVRKA